MRETNHSRLPVQDGPRGVGWMSGYVSGKVDNDGRLVFAELAGRVGWLTPTGARTHACDAGGGGAAAAASVQVAYT